MNLESGSNMTQNNSLSKLKAASKTALQTITETPYQPIVYAIPKEDWNAFQQYLKEAITFQPTLHEQISALMTKAEMEDTLETTTSALSKWSKQFSDEVIDSAESTIPFARPSQRKLPTTTSSLPGHIAHGSHFRSA